ncbi:MAG: O-succinylhomoserine sulfhydrylase [Alphaproteobacteria bacterium]|nr:O-succinylhomoserine sulfhydrylase [Alphaproteobacteria bacterium]
MKQNTNKSKWKQATKLVRGGTMRSQWGETSEALFLNSGFCYDNAETAEKRFNGEEPGFVYSRYLNPTLAMLEQRMALLEGAERCCVVASGMAAVFAAIMCQIRAGDHVVSSRALFSSCHYILTELLPRWGVEVTLVDGRDVSAWKKALSKKTKLVFLESPSNPALELIDIAAVAKLAHKAGARLIVDNVFCSPLLQKPLELGADIVVYSTTKHIDGQGRTLGGAVLGTSKFIDDELVPFHRHTGPALSPFNAWVALKGLETLDLRMAQHGKNAMKVAEFLEKHKKIEKVIYPGLKSHPQYALAKKQTSGGGNMIAFYVKGNKRSAFAFLNKLEIIDISNTLGDAKSLITHPATTTHFSLKPEDRKKFGITDTLLRLSVGLEDADDLIADLKKALG